MPLFCRTLQVFLSATLSNASEFAAWVAHLHKSPCHVVFTDYRPTPLQHYAFPMGVENPGLFLVSQLTSCVQCDCFICVYCVAWFVLIAANEKLWYVYLFVAAS